MSYIIFQDNNRMKLKMNESCYNKEIFYFSRYIFPIQSSTAMDEEYSKYGVSWGWIYSMNLQFI